MELITSMEELKENLLTLEGSRSSGATRDDYVAFIKNAACVVLYKTQGRVLFGPSRFVGYKKNSIDDHADNWEKDGRITNTRISKILNRKPLADDHAEALYDKHCQTLGFSPHNKKRKYWLVEE